MAPSDREIMMDIAWRWLGIPYRWGGDDPMAGFDCSGLVVECLQSVGLIGSREDYSAQGLWYKLKDKQVTTPEEGCLVFWENTDGKIIHVEICISERLAIGAKGGGRQIKSTEDAIIHNAYIKVRPFLSRSRIKGFIDPFKE
jgi:cell wall-associated NlpC family hydrolase